MSSELSRTRQIRLHGRLAEIVGTTDLSLAADSPAEAVRAIVLQFPAARAVIVQSDWVVTVAGRECSELAYCSHSADHPIELIPALSGAEGKAGPIKILLGIFLIIGAFFTAGAAAGAAGGFGAALGGEAAATFLGVSMGTIAKLGAAVALSGLATTLTPSPDVDFDLAEQPESRSSNAFPALANLLQQGAVVPIVYGETVTGSVTVSAIETVIVDLTQNVTTSESTVEIVDLLSEGEIEGLVDGAEGIYFEKQPVLTPAGGYNFEDVLIETRNGEPAPADSMLVVSGRLFAVGLEARYSDVPLVTQTGGAVEWTINDTDVARCSAVVSVPSAWQIDPFPGSPSGTLIGIIAEVRPNGGAWEEFRWGPIDLPLIDLFIDQPAQIVSSLSGYHKAAGGFYIVADTNVGQPNGFGIGSPVTATLRVKDGPLGTPVDHVFETTFTTAATNAFTNAYIPANYLTSNICAHVAFDIPWLKVTGAYNFQILSDMATRYPGDQAMGATDELITPPRRPPIYRDVPGPD